MSTRNNEPMNLVGKLKALGLTPDDKERRVKKMFNAVDEGDREELGHQISIYFESLVETSHNIEMITKLLQSDLLPQGVVSQTLYNVIEAHQLEMVSLLAADKRIDKKRILSDCHIACIHFLDGDDRYKPILRALLLARDSAESKIIISVILDLYSTEVHSTKKRVEDLLLILKDLLKHIIEQEPSPHKSVPGMRQTYMELNKTSGIFRSVPNEVLEILHQLHDSEQKKEDDLLEPTNKKS